MSKDGDDKKTVNKALSSIRSGEIGQPHLMTSNSFVSETAKKELKVPNLWHTVDEMLLDPTVKQPIDVSTSFKTNALALGWFESTGTSTSNKLAEYGDYLIHNMKGQTWFEAVQNMNTDMTYGFSLGEITTKRAASGPYKGSLVLDHIGPRTAKSVYAWVWDKYKRNVTHVIQKPMDVADFKLRDTRTHYLGSVVGTKHIFDARSNKYPVIPAEKLLHIKYNPTFSNPQGNTPLLSAFAPWQEKNIISRYQVIGITRDFGGIPVLRVPSELLERANDPEGRYPADTEALRQIEADAANTHAGKNAFFLMSSDLVDQSNSIYEYDIKLLGVDGSGKQFDISEIIKQKTTEIYNAFSMGHLILGQNGSTSSYNLSTSGQSVSSIILQRDLINTTNVINTILPTLLDAQGISYEYKDLPKFRWKEVNEVSLEDLGKFIQRTASVNKTTPEILEELHKRGPFESVDLSGLYDLDYTDKGQSRSGEGMGTSGTGGKQSGGANSATNTENKSLFRSHTSEGNYQEPLNIFKGEDGKFYDLDTCNPIGED